MPSRDDVASKESRVLGVDTDTNAEVVVTVTGGAQKRVVVHSLLISASGAPAAPVAATLAINGATVTIQIPAGAFAPILLNFNRSLVGNLSENVVLTVPALGSGVVCSATLFGTVTR